VRTRRSPKGQERLYRQIGRVLARKAKEAADKAPEGYEADPNEWPCPDGPYCKDPECAALKAAVCQIAKMWAEAQKRNRDA
jgi:hypothetical protein